MPVNDAVEWHTQIARDFDNKYSNKKIFKERFQVWQKVIDQFSGPEKNVLDVGCGSGIFAIYSSKTNKSVMGVDGSIEMLNICQEKKKKYELDNLDFLQCSIESLPSHLDRKFDLILCSSVLEYLDDFDEALENITSLLADGGSFVFSIPNRNSLYRKMEAILFKLTSRPKYFKFVRNVFTVKETEKRIKKLEFKMVHSSYYAPAPILSFFFRMFGLARYADNLFIAVIQKVPGNTSS